MEQRKQKCELSEERIKNISNTNIKGKNYRTISKQLRVLLTTADKIIKKQKFHGTVVNLSEHGRTRKYNSWLIRLIQHNVSPTISCLGAPLGAEIVATWLRPSICTVTLR